jgi:PhnB protein
MAKAVPDGMHTITAQLTIDGCDKAIEWYKKAFGAELIARAPDPSGKKVWHAMMRIGSSMFFVNDTFPEMGGSASTASLWIYTDGVDQAWKRAVDAGGKVMMPMADMFWGDRMGTLTDPFGNRWNLAQHMKDLTPAEMQKAQDAFVAQMAAAKK